MKLRMGMTGGGEGRDKDSMLDYPSIREDVRGMRFLEAVVASSSNGSAVTAL